MCHIANILSDYNTTSDGWLEWNGAQYYINSQSMAMEDARRYCQEKHGDLVTINSEAENVFLWKQVRGYHLYCITEYWGIYFLTNAFICVCCRYRSLMQITG